MKLQNTAIAALLLLATCSEGLEPGDNSTVESAKKGLGKLPASEVAVWQKVGSSTAADGCYLQAAAFDEARNVVVMFGGIVTDPSYGIITPSQDTWEWNPTTGKWTRRTLDGSKPDARSGAAMVYDSARAKLILFGGRAGSGFNLEDTWEWDPATGVWTDVGATGNPPARSQHAMVFEKSTGKVLMFGGGRSDTVSADGSGVKISLGDTWEYDPATKAWSQRTVTAAPSLRNDSAMVWDSSRNMAVLFGGLQVDISGAAGVPKQDTWDWDPTAGTWTERTAAGSKPSQRYGHALAFDGTRKKMVVFGGWDMSTGLAKADLWDWEPTTGAWTQRLNGSEAGVPTGRMYASMLSDDVRDRMLVVGGALISGWSGVGGTGGSVSYPDAAIRADMSFAPTPSREVLELNPVTPAFTDRTPPLDVPTARYGQAMAFNSATGKTCVFGGADSATGQVLGDYWEWDGKTWTQPPLANLPPSARAYSAMAFDPVRKSMILFGGVGDWNVATGFAETWELTSAGKWVQLSPTKSPEGLLGAGMVTDTARKKILLFGGAVIPDYSQPIFNYEDTIRNQVWEWDGGTLTWTNRTPPETENVPHRQQNPPVVFDEGRQKLFLYEGVAYGGSLSAFYEWDPITAGWVVRDTADALDYASVNLVAYDSWRRRVVILTDAFSSAGLEETWEVDTVAPTWYVRTPSPSASSQYSSSMVFDSSRGVVVLLGGLTSTMAGNIPAETWEYKVTGWGNGEGCTAATASQCASGFCVDGVCCDVAACTGACKSCSVPGMEGTCVLAKAGAEVAGSCEAGKACDGAGSCKAKNGVPCAAAGECASGFCTEGVCCESACTGNCRSCNQAGRAGQCTPFQAGTDPRNECVQGSGVCKSTCDGVGSCAFPRYGVSCGNCQLCDGYGSCSMYDYNCIYTRPDAGPLPTDGGPYPMGGIGGGTNTGGIGGYTTARGGAGGLSIPVDARPYGGSGGTSLGYDGSAGGIPRSDGSAGTTVPRTDGSAGFPGVDGAAGSPPRTDSSAGGAPGFGGSGGAVFGFGGSGGAVIGLGGSVPIAGGTGGKLGGTGGGAGDAGVTASLHKDGCSCDVGLPGASRAAFAPLFGAVGLALLLARRRRKV
jgi:MYXO-CTERM domain-containing protein